MNREQLEHAIRTACQIIGYQDVIVIGSQAILGTYDEDELPREATLSAECDILPIADTDEETRRLADQIEGVAGEWSAFESLHGFSIDGADLSTAILPAGWRERLVRVSNANTSAPSGTPRFTGWCLEPHDLCVAKLCAGRHKDHEFVDALLKADLIDRGRLKALIPTVDAAHSTQAERALLWLG